MNTAREIYQRYQTNLKEVFSVTQNAAVGQSKKKNEERKKKKSRETHVNRVLFHFKRKHF